LLILPIALVIRPVNAAQDYFPLEVGNSWTYEWSNTIYHPTIITEILSVVSVELLGYGDGSRSEIAALWYLGDTERARGEFFIDRAFDALTWAGYGSSGSAGPLPIPLYMVLYYTGPMPGKFLPIPLNLGDAWTTSGVAPGSGTLGAPEYLSYETSSEALRYESVSVPAGTFNCILVETVITALNGSDSSRNYLSGTRYMWFAEGVGLVKLTYHHNDGSVTEAELIEYGQAPFLHPPEIPAPPYIPSSAQEDITSVGIIKLIAVARHAYVWIKIIFASETPPEGQEIIILPTTLIGNPPSERPAPAWGFIPVGGAPSNTYVGWVMLDLDESYTENGDLFIAIYAWLSGARTDRAPDEGMYRIVPFSQPNTFTDSPETSPPQPPKPPPRVTPPVGGILTPVNKFVILAPYLALIGLAAIATIAVKKRKR
jgi:hypothetical protein